MAVVYTAGHWRPHEGQEEAFVEAWTEFGRWLTTMDGATAPRLTRDLGDPERYFSFAAWRDIESIRAWKSHPEFAERMGRVQKHIAEFRPVELELVVEVETAAQPS